MLNLRNATKEFASCFGEELCCAIDVWMFPLAWSGVSWWFLFALRYDSGCRSCTRLGLFTDKYSVAVVPLLVLSHAGSAICNKDLSLRFWSERGKRVQECYIYLHHLTSSSFLAVFSLVAANPTCLLKSSFLLGRSVITKVGFTRVLFPTFDQRYRMSQDYFVPYNLPTGAVITFYILW